MTVTVLVNIVGIVAVALVCAYYFYRLSSLFGLRLRAGTNDNTLAAEMFITLVGEAENEMLVCDDGNSMAGSVYENPDVVDAVRGKLERSGQFRMRCLFSSNDRTKFRAAFDDAERVEIKSGASRRDIHYKIIDRGRKGYLSRHPQGGVERSYRFYDGVPTVIRKAVFGRYVADMDREFHAA